MMDEKGLYTETEKSADSALRIKCLDFARSIRIKDSDGDPKLTADDILEAAKKFYEFVK